MWIYEREKNFAIVCIVKFVYVNNSTYVKNNKENCTKFSTSDILHKTSYSGFDLYGFALKKESFLVWFIQDFFWSILDFLMKKP